MAQERTQGGLHVCVVGACIVCVSLFVCVCVCLCVCMCVTGAHIMCNNSKYHTRETVLEYPCTHIVSIRWFQQRNLQTYRQHTHSSSLHCCTVARTQPRPTLVACGILVCMALLRVCEGGGGGGCGWPFQPTLCCRLKP